jgi:hypothetical protein
MKHYPSISGQTCATYDFLVTNVILRMINAQIDENPIEFKSMLMRLQELSLDSILLAIKRDRTIIHAAPSLAHLTAACIRALRAASSLFAAYGARSNLADTVLLLASEGFIAPAGLFAVWRNPKTDELAILEFDVVVNQHTVKKYQNIYITTLDTITVSSSKASI